MNADSIFSKPKRRVSIPSSSSLTVNKVLNKNSNETIELRTDYSKKLSRNEQLLCNSDGLNYCALHVLNFDIFE